MDKGIKKRFANAMVGLAIVLIVGGVLVFTIPRFKALWADLGSELPTWITVVVVISDFVSKYWYAIFPPIWTALAAYVVVPALVRKPEH